MNMNINADVSFFITSMYGYHTAGEIFVCDVLEADVAHHRFQLFLRRKFTNTLHQVLIRPSIAGDELAELWDDIETIEIVQALQRLALDVAELKNHVLATRLQASVRVGERRVRIRNIS